MSNLKDCKITEQNNANNANNVNKIIDQPKNSQKNSTNQPKISFSEIHDFDVKYENDSNHKSDSKFTKLHFAAKIDSKEIGEVLISKGADINAKNIIYLNIII